MSETNGAPTFWRKTKVGRYADRHGWDFVGDEEQQEKGVDAKREQEAKWTVGDSANLTRVAIAIEFLADYLMPKLDAALEPLIRRGAEDRDRDLKELQDLIEEDLRKAEVERGPCPRTVRRAIFRRTVRETGVRDRAPCLMSQYAAHPTYRPWMPGLYYEGLATPIGKPKTKLRREYDRWRRRGWKRERAKRTGGAS